MRAVVGGEHGGRVLESEGIPFLEDSDMATLLHRGVTPSPTASTPGPRHPHSLTKTTSRPRQPAGHLTLHAYRRLQATPSPPPVEHGRRIKRRPAASHLKQSDRAPPSQGRSFSSLPQVSRSEELLRQPGPSFAQPHLPSFQSLPTCLPNYPLIAEPSPPPSRDASDDVNNASSATDNVPSEAKLNSRAHDRGRQLKPIKRLPRPSDAELRPWAYSPLRVEDPSSGRSSSTGLTPTSTLTLSKFPFPKPPHSQPPLVPKSANSSSKPHSHPQVTHLADTPPPTPATLHYRGTAFDVVNPHQSLYFSKIETPADRNTEFEDYFLQEPLYGSFVADKMAPESRDDDSRSMSAHGRQHRALFDDLQSAHAFIARSAPIAPHPDTTPSAADFPLPPVPAVLHTARHHKFEPFEETITSPAALCIKKAERPRSFMQRVSNALNIDKWQKPTPRTSMRDVTDVDPTQNSVSVAEKSPRAKGHSAPVVGLDQEREIEIARALKRISMSESALPDDGYYDYDVESLYGSTNGDHYSASLYHGSGANRRSVPFGVKEQVTDYSSETEINSYAYEFGASQNSLASPQYSQRHSKGSFTQHGNSNTRLSHHGSTIGSIINGYGYSHSGDITEASLEDLIECDNDVVHVSNIQNEKVGLDLTRNTAGFSQFDFNIHQGASASSSPKTPEFGMSPEIPGSRYNQAGSPPHAPPPAPPADGHYPRPPLGRFNSGISSEFVSRVSSYGDTRRLLLISGDLQASYGRMSVKDEDLVPVERGSVPQTPARNPDQNGSQSSSGSSIYEHPEASPQVKIRQGPSRRAICYTNQRAIPASSSHPIIPTLESTKSIGLSSRNFNDAEYSDHGNDEGKFSKAQIPMIWRKSSPGPQKSLAPPALEPQDRKSFSTISSLDDPHYDANRASSGGVSWETVGNHSYPNLLQRIPANNATDAAIFSNAARAQGDDEISRRGQAHYSTEGFAQDASPSLDFQGGTGFPHLNVLAPKPDAGLQYEHPNPLRSNHVNPFSSSPPPMTPDSLHSPQFPRFSISYDGRFSQEGTNRTAGYATRGVPDEYMEDGIPLVDLQLTPEQTEALLKSGPNESILIDSPPPHREEAGQVLYRKESRKSRGWKPLPLRVGEHIAGHSHHNDRENSFSKLTVLGPQINLTGTPNGTGMKDAGSSVVRPSTSRAVIAYDPTLDNSSMPAYYASPLNRFSANRSSTAYSARGSIPSMGPTDSQTNILGGRRMGSPLAEVNTKHRTPGQSNPASPLYQMKRTSVRSQTELRPIRLGRSQDESAIGKVARYFPKEDASQCVFRRPAYRQSSTETILYDVDARTSNDKGWTWECIPHLERAHVQPAAVPRQNKLSWGILALVSCFPPLLVLYSIGWLDFLIVWWSGGQIDQFGRQQKTFAMVLGIGLSFVLPCVAITMVVLVHLGLI